MKGRIRKIISLLLVICLLIPTGGMATSAEEGKPSARFVKLAAGSAHTVAIKSDGTLWAWGRNDYGQLGDGRQGDNDLHTPTQIGSDDKWVLVSAGGYHNHALKSDGTLWAWGNNSSGQLGDDTTTHRDTPTQIGAAAPQPNTAPVAQNSSITIDQDTTATIAMQATDADSDPLTYSVVTNPSHGTLSGQSSNTINYRPNSNYAGSDSFTFKANDGTVDSNVATISITVRDTQAPTWSSPTLTSSNVSQTSLTLTWSGAQDNVGVVGYRVTKDGANPVDVVGTTVSIIGLSANTTYTFRVEAKDAQGNFSTTGPSITVTTLAQQSSPGSSYAEPPAKPTDLPKTADDRKRKSFDDVKPSHWAHDYIGDLTAKGVIDGKSEKTFVPEARVTKAEFIKMLVVALGWELEEKDRSSFTDVDKSHWSYKYIETAKSKGVISGYKGDSFKPNQSITRAEAAKIIADALGLAKSGKGNLKDVKSNWAERHIVACAEGGIIEGYPDGTFKPNNTLTRAEATKIVYDSITTPLAPTNLTATRNGNQVTLTWAASEGATGYILYRSTTSGGPYQSITVGTTTIMGIPVPTNVVTSRIYTDTGLQAGSTYYYVVKAVNEISGYDGNYSSEVSVIIPSSNPL